MYQKLADNTCSNAGKRKARADDKIDSKLYGDELRNVIGKTAVIATIKGQELISLNDLGAILDEEEFRITKDDVSKILVSYYFKGGNDNAGCEFIHKSREYFFAESLYNTLTTAKGNDFISNIIKYVFAVHFSDEIKLFLEDFFKRAASQKLLDLKNELAKLWKWWLSGAPAQTIVSQNDIASPALFCMNKNLIKLVNSNKSDINTLNGVLGCNILYLNVLINSLIFNKTGIDIKNLVREDNTGNNENECFALFRDSESKKQIYLFEPFKPKKSYLFGLAKILSLLTFESKNFLLLKNCCIADTYFVACSRVKIDIESCYLESVNFSNFIFHDLVFKNSLINESTFSYCQMPDSEFRNCVLTDTRFSYCDLTYAGIQDCSAKSILFYKTDLKESKIKNSYFAKAQFINADFTKSLMSYCNLSGAKFRYCNFKSTTLHKQICDRINVQNSDFNTTKITSGSYRCAVFEKCDIQNLTIKLTLLPKFSNPVFVYTNIVRHYI